MFEIKNLTARIEDKEILCGVNLVVPDGEIHAIMGPNGAGKSTLSYVLSGREGYEVTGGEVIYNGQDILAMEPEERAAAGIFLAFQYPVELPGVGNANFIRTALNAVRRARGEEELDAVAFLKQARAAIKSLSMQDDMLKRNVNVGFSGGEKKRNEVLQMALLQPGLAILDETDSGPGYRRAENRCRWRERAAQPELLCAGDHALPAPARAHRAGPGACAGSRPDCALGRA